MTAMDRVTASTNSPDETLDLTSALGDPTRYAIYQTIVEAAGAPLTVAEMAERFSLHPNVARMHLQKLVDVALVQVDTRKSPGGGRPARIYRLSDRVASLNFPPRDYRLLAGVALQVLESLAGEQPDILDRVGYDLGREEGRKALRRDRIDPADRDLPAILESFKTTCVSLGLFPRIELDQEGAIKIEVRNCVFRELSTRHPDLVCALHASILRGILETYLDEFRLESRPAICTGEGPCLFSVTLAASPA
jgi:predicted ArsR family transcriptional regulator